MKYSVEQRPAKKTISSILARKGPKSAPKNPCFEKRCLRMRLSRPLMALKRAPSSPPATPTQTKMGSSCTLYAMTESSKVPQLRGGQKKQRLREKSVGENGERVRG
eukprot:1405456-Pleurochrysis_carterae.AAC.1